MGTLAYELVSLLKTLDGDATKYISVANNKATLKEVVLTIWKDPDAHNLILSHINAFYLRKDERPKKGPDKDRESYICEICSDDSLIRSELDTHRELIALELRKHGMVFDELHIKPSRRGMKEKHPFRDIS